jgi:hypothetical protein
MHPWPFEASLDDVFVGTLHHARTNGPALLSERRILHQCLSLAQVVQMLLDPFVLSQITPQTISHAQERARTTMFEDMQTPFEHLMRKTHSGFL